MKKLWLLAALFLFMAGVQAEGVVYEGGFKPTSCSSHAGGAEIDRVEIRFTQNPNLSGLPEHTIVMSGGCLTVPFNFRLGSLPNEGQWYQYAITFYKNGMVSAPSASVPFVYKLSTPTAAPPSNLM